MTANLDSAKSAGVVPEGFIRSGPFTAIPDMLRSEGVDPVAVLAVSGLDNSVLARSENVIPFAAAQRLLAIAAAPAPPAQIFRNVLTCAIFANCRMEARARGAFQCGRSLELRSRR